MDKNKLIVKKIFDRVINGKRLVIKWHSFPDALTADWYCGYLGVNPKSSVANLCEEDLDYNYIFPSAIGGVTWHGNCPGEQPDGRFYIGFDTAHYWTKNATSVEVQYHLMDMAKEFEAYEHKANKEDY